MESFYLLIPIGLIFVAIAIRFLFWAIHSGQYDNLDTEAHRILFEEDKQNTPDAPGSAPTAASSAAPAESAASPAEADLRTSARQIPSSRAQESSHD